MSTKLKKRVPVIVPGYIVDGDSQVWLNEPPEGVNKKSILIEVPLHHRAKKVTNFFGVHYEIDNAENERCILKLAEERGKLEIYLHYPFFNPKIRLNWKEGCLKKVYHIKIQYFPDVEYKFRTTLIDEESGKFIEEKYSNQPEKDVAEFRYRFFESEV